MGNNIDIDEFLKILKETTEVLKEKIELDKKASDQDEKAYQRSIEQAAGYTRINGKLISQEQHRIDLEAKLNKELESQFGLAKSRKEKEEAYYKEQLRSMNYAIDANGQLIKTTSQLNSAQRQQIASLKRSEEVANNLQKAQDEFKENLKKGVGDLGKGLGSFALNLGKGSTNFATLNPIIDIVANSMGALAKAVPIFGDAASAGIKAAAEGSKFILDLLDKNIKSFQELSNAGALVGNGMKGMSDQFLASGMSLEGFKKAIKENSSALVAYGGTVGLGANKFTTAVGMLTKPNGELAEAGLGLRQLGLTADDIGEQAGAFLQQEIRLGRGRQMNAKELADGTVKYVRELDLLQKVTGLSRQDAQKQRDELMSDSRYRASRDAMIADGQEDGAKALDAFIMTVKDPELKRGVMDLASGVVSTEAAGKAITAYGESIPEIIERFKNVKGSEEAAKAFDQAGVDMQEAGKRFKENFGEAAKYLDPAALGNYATAADYAAGKMRTSMEKAIEIQDAQIKGNDQLTKDAVKAQQSLEALSIKMFEMGNDMLPFASSAVEKFATSLNELADYIKKQFGIGNGTTIATESEANTRVENAKKKLESAKQRGDEEGASTAQREVNAATNAKDLAEIARRNRKAPGTGAPVQPSSTRGLTPKRASTQSDVRKSDNAIASAEMPAVTPEDVMKLIKFQGDALGTRSHFDALDPYVQQSFMNMIAEYGKPVQINAAMRSHAEQQTLYDKWIANGMQGNPVAKPGRSKHNFGRALDLNSSQVADLKSRGLLAKYGFNTIDNDPPHIEMARFGGVFKGPASGYPVMLHGEEVAMPRPQFDELANGVKKESVTTAYGGTTNMVTNNPSDSSSAMLQELIGLMEDKFDSMIDKLSTGNDISDKLLRNSMV
jgi:hypothetical protein